MAHEMMNPAIKLINENNKTGSKVINFCAKLIQFQIEIFNLTYYSFHIV